MTAQLVSENFQFEENHYNFKHQSGTNFKVDHVCAENNGK